VWDIWDGVGKGEFVRAKCAGGAEAGICMYIFFPSVCCVCILSRECFRVYCLLSLFAKHESKGEKTSRRRKTGVGERERERKRDVRVKERASRRRGNGVASCRHETVQRFYGRDFKNRLTFISCDDGFIRRQTTNDHNVIHNCIQNSQNHKNILSFNEKQ
jgi:hypothetical protein